jgi:HK97 family phage prohead protease
MSHLRAFPTELVFPTEMKAEGRLLTGRLVPYNVVANVADELPDGRLDIYKEGFRPGAFGPQVNTREKGVFTKIKLRHCHDDSGLGFLGPFVSLREQADGLWGDVAVLKSKAGDVQDLLDAGVNELSIEFAVSKRAESTAVDDVGVRWRTMAHLMGVALEAKGAYSEAQVMAFRSERDAAEVEDAERRTVEQAEAEEADRLAKEAAAEQADRRARFDAVCARLDGDMETQRRYVREFGIVQPGGFVRVD